MSSNVSKDLIWSVTKRQNKFLVKTPSAGGVEFSRDPLNPTGKNDLSSSGLVQKKAVGVIKCPQNGKITLITKNAKQANKPAKNYTVSQFKKHISGRRAAAAVAKAAQGYRNDQLQSAVIKASALARADNKPGRTFEKKARA